MSGHSKWHSIKHKKAAVDAKRGAAFTKLLREVTISARMGGGDPGFNPRLRSAVAACKSQNVPNKNIDNAIKKGTGEIEGAIYEEITYEGYGPGGVAVLVEAQTDNKNRTGSEVRHAFTKNNGSLGEPGSVLWMFDQRGRIAIDGGDDVGEDELMMTALENGAEDVINDGDSFTILSDPSAVWDLREKLEEAGYAIESCEVAMVPKNTVQVEEKDAKSLLKMLEMLEGLDDTQNISANFEMDDALMEELSNA